MLKIFELLRNGASKILQQINYSNINRGKTAVSLRKNKTLNVRSTQTRQTTKLNTLQHLYFRDQRIRNISMDRGIK